MQIGDKLLYCFTIFTQIDYSINRQTLTLEITNKDALKVLQDLQEKNFINIIAEPDFSSLVYPGKPLSSEEFKEWVQNRENGQSMSLKEAKVKWAKKKKELLKLPSSLLIMNSLTFLENFKMKDYIILLLAIFCIECVFLITVGFSFLYLTFFTLAITIFFKSYYKFEQSTQLR